MTQPGLPASPDHLRNSSFSGSGTSHKRASYSVSGVDDISGISRTLDVDGSVHPVIQAILAAPGSSDSDETAPLVSALESIYANIEDPTSSLTRSSVVSMLDSQISILEAEIKNICHEESSSLLVGLQSLMEVQDDYYDVKDRVQDLFSTLQKRQESEQSFHNNFVIFKNMKLTIVALKNQLAAVSYCRTIMDELKELVTDCNFYFVLQVVEAVEADYLSLLPSTELVMFIRAYLFKLKSAIKDAVDYRLELYLGQYLNKLDLIVGTHCLEHYSSFRSQKAPNFLKKYPFLDETEYDPLASANFDGDTLLDLHGIYRKLNRERDFTKKFRLYRESALESYIFAPSESDNSTSPCDISMRDLISMTGKICGHLIINYYISTSTTFLTFDLPEIYETCANLLNVWKGLAASTLSLFSTTSSGQSRPQSTISVVGVNFEEIQSFKDTIISFYMALQIGTPHSRLQGLGWDLSAILSILVHIFYLSINQLRLQAAEQLQRIVEEDSLEKYVASDEGELKALADKFSFVNRNYFEEDHGDAALRAQLRALMRSQHDEAARSRASSPSNLQAPFPTRGAAGVPDRDATLVSRSASRWDTASSPSSTSSSPVHRDASPIMKVDLGSLELVYPLKLKFSSRFPELYDALIEYLNSTADIVEDYLEEGILKAEDIILYLNKTLKGLFTDILVPCLLDRQVRSRGQKIQVLCNLECFVEVTADLELYCKRVLMFDIGSLSLTDHFESWKKKANDKSIIK